MAIPATRLKLETLRTIQRPIISRFTIPTVAAGSSSPIYSLEVGTSEGIIDLFRVHAPTGTDYTVAIRTAETATDNSVLEVFRVEKIDILGYQEAKLGISYTNDDNFVTELNPDLDSYTVDTQNWVSSPELPLLPENKLLYAQIHNIGGTPTGVVTLELVIHDAS